MTKKRLDVLLVERGLSESRNQAQGLIRAGQVHTRDQRLDKPGTLVDESVELTVRAPPKYVSRGGSKLEGALTDLAVHVEGKCCVDIGASTGGFTDCLLQAGAAHVYAVDVAKGLLADKLRSDPRVTVMDATNARFLSREHLERTVDLVVVDASFIGIAKLMPAVSTILNEGAQLLAMIKPQFEVGKDIARKSKGVIRDETAREAALDAACGSIEAAGFSVKGRADSRVKGPKGNLEHFVWAERRTGSD